MEWIGVLATSGPILAWKNFIAECGRLCVTELSIWIHLLPLEQRLLISTVSSICFVVGPTYFETSALLILLSFWVSGLRLGPRGGLQAIQKLMQLQPTIETSVGQLS